MLFPKIQRNSRFPARWTTLPCRNIDTSTASHTDLWGNPAGCRVDPTSQASSRPDLVGGPQLVDASGAGRATTSQGMAACSDAEADVGGGVRRRGRLPRK